MIQVVQENSQCLQICFIRLKHIYYIKHYHYKITALLKQLLFSVARNIHSLLDIFMLTE